MIKGEDLDLFIGIETKNINIRSASNSKYEFTISACPTEDSNDCHITDPIPLEV